MKIQLKSLHLSNFKGIKKLDIQDFNPQIQSIYGDNATGKTTILDAFLYLLFGKNSEDKADFNIKNTVNTELNREEHIVSAIIIADGTTIELKKVFKEKWVKKRGEETAEFSGNTKEFFYNGVPMQEKEYKSKIDQLTKEDVFKMLTNVLYFTSMKWQDQRAILFDMADSGSVDAALAGRFSDLLSKLTGKSLAEYKKEIAAKKKLYKEELTAIPYRIDELSKSMPEAVNVEYTESEIRRLTLFIDNINSTIKSERDLVNKANESTVKKQRELNNLNIRLSEIVHSYDRSVLASQNEYRIKETSLKNGISRLNSDISDRNVRLKHINNSIQELQLQISEQREFFKLKNAEQFILNTGDEWATCPTCKRELEAGDIDKKQEEMHDAFNEEKRKQLNKIRQAGIRLSDQLANYNEQKQALELELKDLNVKLSDTKAELDNHRAPFAEPTEQFILSDEQCIHISGEIKRLEEEINNDSKLEEADTSVYVQEIKETQARIDSLKDKLRDASVIQSSRLRIETLKEREKEVAQQLADLERTEFAIDSYNKEKISLIEHSINSKFEYVKFRLFEEQVNGATVETCEATLHSVPYSDLNNAGRINAGLDIINALSAHYNLYAPCFVDNAESVTSLIPSKTQLIRLIVSENDKTLRIA